MSTQFRADWLSEGGSVARLQDDEDPFRLVHCARCGAFINYPREWDFHRFVAFHSSGNCKRGLLYAGGGGVMGPYGPV